MIEFVISLKWNTKSLENMLKVAKEQVEIRKNNKIHASYWQGYAKAIKDMLKYALEAEKELKEVKDNG